MSHKINIAKLLDNLGISQTEAAHLLSVSPRTVRRWVEKPDETSGPAIQALEAWLGLKNRGIPWKPGELMLGEESYEETAEQIARLREYNIQLNNILLTVDKRGGPQMPWDVDLKKNIAKLGTIYISFDRLTNGGFAPYSYRRTDKEPDQNRDRHLIEDAYACIAMAIKKIT